MLKETLDNKGVSAVLQDLALLLELKGENLFKAAKPWVGSRVNNNELKVQSIGRGQ
jgi:hypothetical protein